MIKNKEKYTCVRCGSGMCITHNGLCETCVNTRLEKLADSKKFTDDLGITVIEDEPDHATSKQD